MNEVLVYLTIICFVFEFCLFSELDNLPLLAGGAAAGGVALAVFVVIVVVVVLRRLKNHGKFYLIYFMYFILICRELKPLFFFMKV